jgi:hypothetical protein
VSPYADAFVDPAKLIPISLHLEMRMGLKMSSMILAEGLNSYMVNSEQVKFIKQIENIVNKKIFGTKESPSSWHFPSAEADGESALLVMGDIRLQNTKVRRLIPNINKISDVCIKYKQRNSMARDCLAHYRNALNVVTCPRKYMKMELWTFQDESHEYGGRLIKSHGLAGCANYAHVFISHILHYMTKYECPHCFSQQGWGHWNAAVTSFFFHRTQRGRFVSEIDNKTKLVPIARWCQRRLMHVSGTTKKIFNGEMLEVEKEIEAEWTDSDEARYKAKLNLRKIQDESTEKEREKVAAMTFERRDRAQKSRDKVLV